MVSNLDHRCIDWVNKWNDSLVSGNDEICIESSAKLSYYALECQSHRNEVRTENLKQVVSNLFRTLIANPEGKITNLLAKTWAFKPASRIPIALLTLKKALSPLFPEIQIPANTCDRETEQLLLALDAILAERPLEGVSAENILGLVIDCQEDNTQRLNEEARGMSLVNFDVDIVLDATQETMKNLIRQISQDPVISDDVIRDCLSSAHEILMKFICKNPSMITNDLLPNLKLFSLAIALKLTVDANITCLELLETLNAMGLFSLASEPSLREFKCFCFISMAVNFLKNVKTELDLSLADGVNQIQADLNAELEQLRPERTRPTFADESHITMNITDQLNRVETVEAVEWMEQLDRADHDSDLYEESEQTEQRGDADLNVQSLFSIAAHNLMTLID